MGSSSSRSGSGYPATLTVKTMMKASDFKALLKRIDEARTIKAGQRKPSRTWERSEALTETLEIMSDKRLMANLRRSLRDVKAGRLIPWEDVKRKLG